MMFEKTATVIIVVAFFATSFVGIGTAHVAEFGETDTIQQVGGDNCVIDFPGDYKAHWCGQGNMGKTDDGTAGEPPTDHSPSPDGSDGNNVGLNNDQAREKIEEHGPEAAKATTCSAIGEVIDGPAIAIGAGVTCSLML